MKQLHRKDLWGWSEFNPERNLDFHSVLWVRPEGNVMIDPLPMSAHDQNHLRQLGGARHIVITNSDHCRDAFHLAKVTGAEILGPESEQKNFPIKCNRWIGDNTEIVPGLIAYQLHGSKTSGELALLLESTTLITGDLIRCHIGGEVCALPEIKLSDPQLAKESIRRLASLEQVVTILVGDGWPLFSQANLALKRLADSL